MMPKGWKHQEFGENVEVVSGYAFKSSEYSEEGKGVRLLRGDNITPNKLRWKNAKHWDNPIDEKLERLFLRSGDLIIAMDRTWISAGLKIAVVKESDLPCLLVQRVARVRAKKTHCQDFISHLITGHRFSEYVKSVQTETAVPHISSKQIKEFPVLVPPLPEQIKIAKILAKWDEAITTTEQLIEASKKQKKALMQKLLTGKERFKEFEEKEWEELSLDKIATFRRGSFPQPYGNAKWFDQQNGSPFIQVYDIDTNMRLKPQTKKNISNAAARQSVFIAKNTVIISIQGSIGRVAITQYDAYVDRTVLLFQEFTKPINKIFFAYKLQQLFEVEKTKAPGGTIKTITKQVLSNFKMILPVLQEQEKIAYILSSADNELLTLQNSILKLHQQKEALMQQLLTGNRRVKIDETEPKTAVAC